MKKLHARRAPLVPLHDDSRGGNTPPQLIGWYNYRTGLILTANFGISMTGSKIAQRRVEALNRLVAKAKKDEGGIVSWLRQRMMRALAKLPLTNKLCDRMWS